MMTGFEDGRDQGWQGSGSAEFRGWRVDNSAGVRQMECRH